MALNDWKKKTLSSDEIEFYRKDPKKIILIYAWYREGIKRWSIHVNGKPLPYYKQTANSLYQAINAAREYMKEH